MSKKMPVNSQMGSKMPSAAGRTHVGQYPVHTHVSLGEKRTATPSQTAGSVSRTPRPGTKQFAYGRNDT